MSRAIRSEANEGETAKGKVEGMNRDEELEALREQHRRLRRAAQAVIDAASYPADGEHEARLYRSQLRGLERELRGIPQPSGMAWMSVS